MQALNAHLNFTKLGAIVEDYEENVYGVSQSPLHRGNPTDRFVCEWWIRKPHVERRLLAPPKPHGREGGEPGSDAVLTLRTSELAEAGRANRTAPAGGWLTCAEVDLALDTRRLMVEIPTGFTEMLSRAPDLALEWRMATRELFTTYFARGYRAVEFFIDRPNGKGAYLLTKELGD
jgi:predicted GNAT superfamily acetyltransferase